MFFCTACFHRRHLLPLGRGLSLCQTCREELAELSLPLRPRRLAGEALIDVLPLYRYQGLMRSLILRAKVKVDQRALLLLLVLATARLEELALVPWADLLIASPASLWSRTRGRLDIAANLAAALARTYGRPTLTAPWHLHWRWRKNARRSAAQRRWLGDGMPASVADWSHQRFHRTLAERLHRAGHSDYLCHPAVAHQSLSDAMSQGTHLLLIDDVYTSGATLRSFATAVQKGGVTLVRGLTLTASSDEALPS